MRLGALVVLAALNPAMADHRPTVVVKLGGSAVTRKDKFETLNQAALRTTAQQIKASCCNSRVLLMHGCGSFGHFQAHEHGISKGTAWRTFSWLGFARTRRSATKLNAFVLDALLAEELPAVHLSPFPLWRKRAGRPTARTAQAGVRNVRELLRAGLMPVLHGDSVIDEVHMYMSVCTFICVCMCMCTHSHPCSRHQVAGCGILSGDALLEVLCKVSHRRPHAHVHAHEHVHAHVRACACIGACTRTRAYTYTSWCSASCFASQGLRFTHPFPRAQALRPELAVFLTDVAGVYSRPPSEPGAELLPEIRVGRDGALSLPTGDGRTAGAARIAASTAAHDVSGGLAAKLESAAAIAAAGVPVCIVQVGTVHAAEALAGRWPARCTRVVSQSQASRV